ncbi:MAG: heme exporter protein CcmD [Arenicellales bacterium]
MNWTEFFRMGGYAFYVWTSFGLALIVLSGNVIWAVKRKQRVIADLKRAAIARGEAS